MNNVMENIIEVEGLSKKYYKSKTFSIENITLKCKAGEIVGLLGKNGAGKSTTIKCITGFLNFESGKVKICGNDIKKNPINAKKNLGYMADNHPAFEKLTGMEYIYFVGDLYGINKHETIKRLNDLEEIFNLGDKMHNLISSYSHGMKQKICLIASLIHKPKLWILDEPSQGLDIEMEHALYEYMKDYSKQNNAILYSSHDLSALERICDRVYIIHDGKIIANIDIKKLKPIENLESVFMTIIGDKL